VDEIVGGRGVRERVEVDTLVGGALRTVGRTIEVAEGAPWRRVASVNRFTEPPVEAFRRTWSQVRMAVA
jgi:hypothetical protein